MNGRIMLSLRSDESSYLQEQDVVMEEKTPVDLTVDEAADALALSTWTVKRHIREDAEDEKRFPNAYLLHGSRKLGYRIPEGDVLQCAGQQGEWLVRHARRVIESARQEQEAMLTKRLNARELRRQAVVDAPCPG